MKKLTIFHGATIGLLMFSLPANADFVINDDLIVDGSACVGFDCVNGESFGFDTIRLKENNLRIGFDDTSVAASYPRNDWQITINDSANGGAAYFGVTDITGGRRVFSVEAGAPSHALYVDDGGRVGFGTSTPSVELHTIDGDTPTLRLQQDGSSGFAPQTWDVAGNETNFFVRDVTNGSTLPIRLRPGAPNSALDIASDGDIGISTSSPSAQLHVVANGDGVLYLENNGPAVAFLHNTAETDAWKFNHATGNQFRIAQGADAVEFALDADGDVTIAGTLTTAGSCSSGCDIVFSETYPLESIEEHAKKMWSNSYLPAVGPTKEGSPFNISEKTGGILNELEKAHIYIEELNSILKTKDSEIDDLKKGYAEIDDLKRRLATLEKHLDAVKN